MALLGLILGILGNAISVLVFSSPLPTFWRIWKRKSTENFKGLPYICTLLSTSLWSYYGLIKPGGTLILTINAAGTVFQAFYLAVFLIYAPRLRKIRTMVLASLLNGVCFGMILATTLLAVRQVERRVFVVGTICSAISVSMYASPLGVMRMVIETRSVEFMPFFLSLFLFLNGGVWALYALIIKDLFVEIPNAIGFFLGCVQLGIYLFYKNAKPKKLEEKEDASTTKKSTQQDVEMGLRSTSLPKNDNYQTPKQSSLPKQTSLPSKILKTSSATLAEVVNFLQDNDPIKHQEREKKKVSNLDDVQSNSPHSLH